MCRLETFLIFTVKGVRAENHLGAIGGPCFHSWLTCIETPATPEEKYHEGNELSTMKALFLECAIILFLVFLLILNNFHLSIEF